MKKTLVLFTVSLSLLFSSCVSSSSQLALQNKKVVFIGDSITHNGRYVSYIEYYLQKNFPEEKFDIISVGLGSETVSGLSEKDHPFPRPCVHSRLENILIETKPQILFTCYGMNDGIYNPQSPARFKAYKDGYDKLLDKAFAAGVEKVVIASPPIYDSLPIMKKTILTGEFSYKRPYRNYNDVLSDYAAYIMSLNRDNVYTADLNGPMLAYTKQKRQADKNFTLSRDGIHPGKEGHLLMAQVILKSLGYKFEFTPPEKASELDAEELFKKVDKKRSLRSRGWLDYIGYTRGKVVKKDSVDETENKVRSLQSEIDLLRK